VSSADGYNDVPAGKIAAVVTSLEMTARPPARDEPENRGWSLRRVPDPDLDWYRDLFRRVVNQPQRTGVGPGATLNTSGATCHLEHLCVPPHAFWGPINPPGASERFGVSCASVSRSIRHPNQSC
jgi:hypothetical protein